MDGQWITLNSLGTFSGVVFAVTLICQFFKGMLDKAFKIPTRVMVLLVSWAILLGYRYLSMGGLTFEHVFLDTLNGFMVALAAMGAHSFAKDNFKWK